MGGERRGMSKKVETLGETLPPLNDLLPWAVNNFM